MWSSDGRLAPWDHRRKAICPVVIDSSMLRSTMGHDFMRDYAHSVRKETRMYRFGKASGIAALAFSVSGEDASLVIGQAFSLAGGRTAGHRRVDRMGLV